MRIFAFTLFLLNLFHCAYGQDTAKWVFTNYPPANYQLADGRFSGFIHDIVIQAFEKRLGIAIKISVFPWKRCQSMVENGSADLMVTIPTPQRLAYTVTHDNPIWVKRRILYTYGGHPRIDDMNRINELGAIKRSGFSVISYLGNGWVESIVQGYGIPVLYATTVEGMYRMLAAKRGDLIIEEESLARPLVQGLGLAEGIVQTKGIASESGFHILISKKSPYASLVSRLNREIEAMRTSGEIDRIINRYRTGSELTPSD